VDTGLGSGIAHHADGFTRAFASACVGLSALATDRQAAQMANSPVALDTLKALEVHADFAAQVTFDDVFAILDGMHNLGKLLFGQILRADIGIDIRLDQDVFGVGGPDTVNIAQSNVDALVRGDFDANDTSHKSKWVSGVLTLTLFVTRIGADHTNDAFAAYDFAIFAKLFD
jgi:hypothetical protein